MPETIRQKLAAKADRNVGLLAEFSDPGSLLHAVTAMRKQGYSRLDTFSPFPIHGMDRAMGLGTSLLGYIVFIGGLTGCALGFGLQWWTSAVDYPINISNKPLFAVEPSVPIIFELTVLFAALTAVGAMLALNGLPRPYNPLFYSERFARATDDGFFLHVQEADRQFDREATAAALAAQGALAVEYVSHDGSETIPASPSAAPSAAAAEQL